MNKFLATIGVAVLSLILSNPTFADVPTYPEENRIASVDVPRYQEALLIEVKRLGIKSCAGFRNGWNLSSYYLTRVSNAVNWYLLNSGEPLIVISHDLVNDSNLSGYPKRTLQFLFYTNSDFTQVERVELNEYLTQYERQNIGNLAQPNIQDVLVTKLVATDDCR